MRLQASALRQQASKIRSPAAVAPDPLGNHAGHISRCRTLLKIVRRQFPGAVPTHMHAVAGSACEQA